MPYFRTSLLVVFVVSSAIVSGQNVRIGQDAGTADPSALLHMDGTAAPSIRKLGFVPPNVALTRTDATGPVGPLPLPPSLLVFNTATTSLAGTDAQYNVAPGYYSWDGSRWLRFEAGVGRQTYVNCSSATLKFDIPFDWAASATSTVNRITGAQTNANLIALVVGDRVILEATGSVQLAFTSTTDVARYTAVEIQLVVNNNLVTTNDWQNVTVIASTVVSLDMRNAGATSNSFFFGLFSSSSSGFAQRSAYQNWSLAGSYDAPTNSNNYRFWVRARKLTNIAGTAGVTTGLIDSPGTNTPVQTCLRTEIFRF